ncbi:Na+/H+ antiporter NhaA [Chloroflexota bacterium]
MHNSQETTITKFLKLETSGGIILMFAAVVALVMANSPLAPFYALLIDTPVEIKIGVLEIAKPLLLWINDGLMAVFFFLVGLELKRELIEGELSNIRNIILPGVGAIGGMLVPGLIYMYFNAGDPTAMKGWAIPAATDIAFALGILSLLGSRVPTSIKIFITSLAIFDDIGAILIIALFYTEKISIFALVVVACCMLILAFMNRKFSDSKSMYVLLGIVMWVAMLKSGVHATLTGVILAMFIPMKSKTRIDYSPLKSMEHDLHFMVAYIILPTFAFANAGISFIGLGMEEVLHSVPLGIVFGLFFGKQLGVFGLCWLAIKVTNTSLPKGMSWSSLYGAAALCGVGFTMSLFIGSLAFEETGINLLFDERLGIIIGSLASGIVGYLVLRRSFRSNALNTVKGDK